MELYFWYYGRSLYFLGFPVFNLANGIDVEETKSQIETYKLENQDAIKKNKGKLVSIK